MLFTVWPKTRRMHMWVSADAFEQFFPEISADEARRQVGPADEERLLDPTAIREFIADLDVLLAEVLNAGDGGSAGGGGVRAPAVIEAQEG